MTNSPKTASAKPAKQHESTEPQRLRRIVESFSKLSVLVMADLIADEFITGEIARVSREAPVLIRKNKISVSGISRLKGHVTTTKTRVLAYSSHSSRQQVVRIDRECTPLGETHPALVELVASAREYAPAADAVLLSDYGYGAISPRLFNFVRAKGALGDTPVTLDSRYRMLEYVGVNAATPNESEVEEALRCKIGDSREVLMQAGSALLRQMKLDSLVITRGGDGMVAFEKRGAPVEIPIHGNNQVVDVTGAGDTVIATFTAALAAGADTASAARLANYAAGIVVMKRGTATVSHDELLAAIDT